MTSVDSAGRIEFLESATRDRRAIKSRRLLVSAIFIIAVAVGLYVYVKSDSEIPMLIKGSGSATSLNMR